MTHRQLELGLDQPLAKPGFSPVRRPLNRVPARWWFARIHATIARALAGIPAPAPRPEQRHLDLFFSPPLRVDFQRDAAATLPEAA